MPYNNLCIRSCSDTPCTLTGNTTGSVRCFNQPLIEQDLIREHLLFYCLEKGRNFWRYFDERTYHSGPVDEEYLTALLEQLL